jgi:hypothetical protein
LFVQRREVLHGHVWLSTPVRVVADDDVLAVWLPKERHERREDVVGVAVEVLSGVVVAPGSAWVCVEGVRAKICP